MEFQASNFSPVGEKPIFAARPNPPRKNNLAKIMGKVDSKWTLKDYWGAFLSRTTSFRTNYTVKPGLYALGNPQPESEVIVTANYKLSFDKVRKNLKNRNLWILVLDTKGINVWCAAGKGTFGTEELAQKIIDTDLSEKVTHRRVIVPQLGAVGVAAREVREKSRFHVAYGPVDARFLPEYLDNNRKATEKMRKVRFNWLDRLVLIPMEIIPAVRHYLKYAVFIAVLFGLQANGLIFENIFLDGGPYLSTGLAAIVAGAFLTPLFLPVLPGRSFAVKGIIAGLLGAALILYFIPDFRNNLWIFAFHLVFLPAASSYLALQFTGSTTFTNMSGVYKEHKYAIPYYIVAGVVSILLTTAHRLSLWGIV